MLNKNRSGKLARLKYLAAVPLCAGMLCASTLVFSKDYGLIELAPRKTIKLRLDSTKYALKITDLRDNLSIVSDKMVHENPKTGVKTTYTVNSLTETGKTDLMKAGMKIEIVERASAFADTNKVLMPPPSIAPVKKPFTAVYSYVNIHGKFPAEALKKHINGAVVLNFDINVPGKLSNVTVAESTHNGYDEFAVNALKKFPYVLKSKAGKYIVEIDFWLPGNQASYLAKNNVRKQPEFIGNIIIQQAPKMPPPPPAPPKQNSMPPPPAPPKVKDQIKLPPPPPPIEPKPAKSTKIKSVAPIVIEEPVVPTPQNTAIQALYTHLGRTIKYPKEARDVKKEGRVIVAFNVTKGKMENIRVVRGVSPEVDREVINSLNSFNKPLPLKASTYSIPLLFTLDHGKSKSAEVREYPLVAYKAPIGNSMALNEIVIVGYPN